MKWKSLSFSDPVSPSMEQMIMFHDHTMMVMMMITMMVMYIMTFIMTNKLTNLMIYQEQMIEMIWTILPVKFLLLVALPSGKKTSACWFGYVNFTEPCTTAITANWTYQLFY